MGFFRIEWNENALYPGDWGGRTERTESGSELPSRAERTVQESGLLVLLLVRERERERVGWVAREDLRPALLPGPLSRQRRRGGSSGGRAVEKGGEGDFRSLAL